MCHKGVQQEDKDLMAQSQKLDQSVVAEKKLGNADFSLSGVVEAIREVGRQRKELLDQLRGALQSGNSEKALVLAHQVRGLSDEKSHRVN
jgi:hypothetical protein